MINKVFNDAIEAVRGIGVMARSIGLVGHIMEEASNPIGMEIWARADKEALSHELRKQ